MIGFGVCVGFELVGGFNKSERGRWEVYRRRARGAEFSPAVHPNWKPQKTSLKTPKK